MGKYSSDSDSERAGCKSLKTRGKYRYKAILCTYIFLHFYIFFNRSSSSDSSSSRSRNKRSIKKSSRRSRSRDRYVRSR